MEINKEALVKEMKEKGFKDGSIDDNCILLYAILKKKIDGNL